MSKRKLKKLIKNLEAVAERGCQNDIPEPAKTNYNLGLKMGLWLAATKLKHEFNIK